LQQLAELKSDGVSHIMLGAVRVRARVRIRVRVILTLT
jgi:hypothetical protein